MALCFEFKNKPSSVSELSIFLGAKLDVLNLLNEGRAAVEAVEIESELSALLKGLTKPRGAITGKPD